MAINILAAVRYPFQSTTWLHAWILPAISLILLQAIFSATFATITTMEVSVTPEFATAIQTSFLILVNVLTFGLGWQISKAVQLQGINAGPVSWASGLFQYLLSGLKLLPYAILVNVILFGIGQIPLPKLPMEVDESTSTAYSVALALGFVLIATPLVTLPPILAARTQSILQLFNIKIFFNGIKQFYIQGLIGTVLALAFACVYAFLGLVTMQLLQQLLPMMNLPVSEAMALANLFINPLFLTAGLATIANVLTQSMSAPATVTEPAEIEAIEVAPAL